MYAASVGDVNVLSLILQIPQAINAQDSAGRTALHYACRGGNTDNINFLL